MYQRLVRWLRATADAYSTHFLLLIGLVYWMQGFRSYTSTAAMYLFKRQLQSSPAQNQALKATAKIPWNIKFVYGLLSDNLPIGGYHIRPYMILAGFLGFLGYLQLWRMPLNGSSDPSAPSTPGNNTISEALLSATFYLFLLNLGVIKNGRSAAEGTSGMQSFCWAALAIGGMMGTSFGGYIVESTNARTLFAIMTVLPLITVYLGWTVTEAKSDVRFEWSTLRRQVQLLMETLRQPRLYRPMLWIFLAQSLSLDIGDGMVYFRNHIGLQADTLGYIDTVAYFGLFLGTLLYAKYFQSSSYRNVFLVTQLLSACLSLLDVVQVRRWNVSLGLPDTLFVLTSDAFSELVGRLQSMPFLIMCAQLCPESIEATLFATLMSISNLSSSVSSYLGAILQHSYGIQEGSFEHFWKCILWRTAGIAISCCFIGLVPNVRSLEITTKTSHGMEFQPLGGGTGSQRGSYKHRESEEERASAASRKDIPIGTSTEVRWRSSAEDLLLSPDEGTSHRRAGPSVEQV